MPQIVKFAVIGGLNTAIDNGLFNLLVHLFHVNVVLANVVSYSCALANSYVLNKIWTFSRLNNGMRSHVQFLLYSAGNLVGLVMSTVIVFLTAHEINPSYAKLLSICVTLPWNYAFSRFVVFVRRRESEVA